MYVSSSGHLRSFQPAKNGMVSHWNFGNNYAKISNSRFFFRLKSKDSIRNSIQFRSETRNLTKKWKFGDKLKFWRTIYLLYLAKFWVYVLHIIQKSTFWQKLKFWPKIEISPKIKIQKNRNFPKNQNTKKSIFFTKNGNFGEK